MQLIQVDQQLSTTFACEWSALTIFASGCPRIEVRSVVTPRAEPSEGSVRQCVGATTVPSSCSRPPEEVRSAIDSALEGDGFELSVPGRESVNIMESGLLSRKRGGSVGEPKVRIHLPPAGSPWRT